MPPFSLHNRYDVTSRSQSQYSPIKLNTLPNDKILDLTKLKAFADDK